MKKIFLIIFIMFLSLIKYLTLIYIVILIVFTMCFYSKHIFLYLKKKNKIFNYTPLLLSHPKNIFWKWVLLAFVYKPWLHANQLTLVTLNFRKVAGKTFFKSLYFVFVAFATGLSRIYCGFLYDFLVVVEQQITFKKKFMEVFTSYVGEKHKEVVFIMKILKKADNNSEFFENFKKESQLSSQQIENCFVQSCFWSTPFKINWILIKSPKLNYKKNFLKKLLNGPNKFCFIYHSPESFLWLGVLPNSDLLNVWDEGLFNCEFGGDIILDEKQIIDFLSKKNWVKSDLINDAFFWNKDYEIIFSSFLLYINFDLVEIKISKWGDPYENSLERITNNPNSQEFEKFFKIQNEFKEIHKKWLEKNNKDADFWKFIYWYRNSLNINQ